MAFAWDDVLQPRRCDVNVRALTRSGGRSATGREQRVQSDAGFVDVSYEIPITSPAVARACRATVTKLRAGEECLAKVFDVNQPRGALGVAVTGELTANIAARDTQIGITVTGAEIMAGTIIGIGANRVHIITEVVSGGPASFFNNVLGAGNWDDDIPWSDAATAARNYVVKVMPPIRNPFAAGTVVKFRDITMRGVLADINDGDLSLDVGRFGSVTFTIRESI